MIYRVGQIPAYPPGGMRGSRRRRHDVPTDGPDRWYVPTSALEFQKLGLNTPDYLYPVQEGSGGLANTIGAAVSLAAVGAPLYQQTLTGWSRRFVGSTSNVQGGFSTTNALLNVAAGQSFAMVALVAHELPVATTRDLLFMGTTNGVFTLLSSTSAVAPGVPGNVRGSSSGGQVNGTLDMSSVGASTAYQICLYRNAATDVTQVVTNREAIALVHSENAMSGSKGFVPFAASAAPTARLGWLAFYLGTNAEFSVGEYLARLRGDS